MSKDTENTSEKSEELTPRILSEQRNNQESQSQEESSTRNRSRPTAGSPSPNPPPRWGSPLAPGQPLPSQLTVTALLLWSCTACKFDNDPRRTTCEKCGTRKAVHSPDMSQSMSAENVTEPDTQGHVHYSARLSHGGFLQCD